MATRRTVARERGNPSKRRTAGRRAPAAGAGGKAPGKKAGKSPAAKENKARLEPAAVRLSPEERSRIRSILRALRREYPEVRTALRYETPFQLLVATILSAQCTDDRVNQVTESLFAKWPTPEDFANVPIPLLEKEIHSTGFFRNKARNIQLAARAIVERYGGKVPDTMEGLLTLPGVARKTANVVLGTAFAKAEGIVVDTHVARVAQRLGLTRHTDPVKIERDLMARIPRRSWIWFAHALIWHGRRVCKARRPDCEHCRLRRWCPSATKWA